MSELYQYVFIAAAFIGAHWCMVGGICFKRMAVRLKTIWMLGVLFFFIMALLGAAIGFAGCAGGMGMR